MEEGGGARAPRLPAAVDAPRGLATGRSAARSRRSMRTTTSGRRSSPATGRRGPRTSSAPCWTRPGWRRSSTWTAATATGSAGSSSAGTAACPGRVAVFAGLDYDSWAVDPAFGESEARRLREGVAAGAKGLKVWKTLGLRARDGRWAPGCRRRSAPRPALGRRRRAWCPDPDPHCRSDRLLRAARRVERALGGAPGAPRLALLADSPARAAGR